MIGYASNTGTRRNLKALRAAGWRILLTPHGGWDPHGFRYACDNGAWSDHLQNRQSDWSLYERLLEKRGAEADWIVAPDIVMGGENSLRLSLDWLKKLTRYSRILIAVQDGHEIEHLRFHVGSRVGIFVGGSSEWKESSLAQWGALARETGCYLHVGRVNSARRIAICAAAGADSFDGTSVTRYAKNLPRLDRARRQIDLFEALQRQHEKA